MGAERLLKNTAENRAYQEELKQKLNSKGGDAAAAASKKGSKRKASAASDEKSSKKSKKRKTEEEEDETVEAVCVLPLVCVFASGLQASDSCCGDGLGLSAGGKRVEARSESEDSRSAQETAHHRLGQCHTQQQSMCDV